MKAVKPGAGTVTGPHEVLLDGVSGDRAARLALAGRECQHGLALAPVEC